MLGMSGVQIGPGATELTRMRLLIASSAIALGMAASALLRLGSMSSGERPCAAHSTRRAIPGARH